MLFDVAPSSPLLNNLNPEQLAAVTLPATHALILAGAGSGKTRVLTTRIAWLLQTRQVSPGGILAVTFTNKAAKEMMLRLTSMLPVNAHLELKTLLSQPVLIELLTDQSRSVLRAFHGHVTAVACVGANGGMARYRLTIEPWLRYLGVGRDSAVFQDLSTPDIVQAVLARYQSRYQGGGKLVPAWRLDLLDASVYPPAQPDHPVPGKRPRLH